MEESSSTNITDINGLEGTSLKEQLLAAGVDYDAFIDNTAAKYAKFEEDLDALQKPKPQVTDSSSHPYPYYLGPFYRGGR